VGVLLITYIPVKFYNIIFRTQNLKDKEFQKRYKTIIVGMRIDNPLRFQFITVFLYRRLIYASVFLFLSNYKFIQVGAALTTVIMTAAYVAIVRPYASGLSTLLSIMNEFFLLSTVAIPGRFLEPIITPNASKAFGNVLIGLIIATIAVNWIIIMVFAISKFIKKRMKPKDKKSILRKITEQEQSSKKEIYKIYD